MIPAGNPQETEDGEEPAELLSDTLLEKQSAAGDTTYFDQIKATMAESAASLAEK